jgi:hypothetical protein
MTPDRTHEELPFADGFAARVFETAGRIAARRRRRGWIAVAAVLAAGAVALRAGTGTAPTPEAAAPAILAAAGPGPDAYGRAAATDPLDYMFPDAAPLARFSEQYASAYGGAAGNDAPFAGDAEIYASDSGS